MFKMKMSGYDCDVDTSLSAKELQKLAEESIKDYANKGTAGLAFSYPRKIYVAHDPSEACPRSSNLLHEMLEILRFVIPGLKKLKEDDILAIEDGLYTGYKSIGHELPDPLYVDPSKKQGRWRFRD